ncbi:hypothetical protein GCM10010176_070820 [Nonomuraea spiralis]|nr:hypothetical protein GCM10010176_070820 [Nonomuraea spiralis]
MQEPATDPIFGGGFQYSMGWARHEADMAVGFGVIMRKLPSLVGICLRLSWRADPTALVIVVVCQPIVSAATAFGLLATNRVLQRILAEGPTPPTASGPPYRRWSWSRPPASASRC